MASPTVLIHYRRPPDRVQVFEQTLVLKTSRWTMTYMPEARLERPVMAGEQVILEPGSPVVWFSYPGEWHDIGRFHLADGQFTGIYANILTPVVMEGDRWETTDLCLDVWLGKDGATSLLDEDEMEEAEALGWIDELTAARAREEAAKLLFDAATGAWPPPHVYDWTLERVRERLDYSSGSSTDAETRRLRSM